MSSVNPLCACSYYNVMSVLYLCEWCSNMYTYYTICGWLHTYTTWACSCGQKIILHEGHILVHDSIALDEVAIYIVCTVNYDECPFKSLHIAHSTNCHSVLCITLKWVHYTKGRLRGWPPFAVAKCIRFGTMGTSLCLQMRVSWSEQSPWSSRETLKTAVITSSVQRDNTSSL